MELFTYVRAEDPAVGELSARHLHGRVAQPVHQQVSEAVSGLGSASAVDERPVHSDQFSERRTRFALIENPRVTRFASRCQWAPGVHFQFRISVRAHTRLKRISRVK